MSSTSDQQLHPHPTTTPGSLEQKASLPVDVGAYFDSAELSDVRVRVEGVDGERTFHAHRLILSASSTYFRSLFSNAWTPTADLAGASASSSSSSLPTASSSEVAMRVEEDVAHAALVLEFLYGREIELDLTCAHPLLRLAGYYGIDALGNLCVDYLERVLHPEPTRCFALFSSGAGGTSMPADPKLLALCTEVIARSFADVAQHEAFLNCSVELLVAVLERDDLAVEREEAVMHALVRWLAHEPAERQPELAQLLGLVRWPTMAGEVLAELEEAQPLFAPELPRLRELLLEALKFQAASPARRSALLAMHDTSAAAGASAAFGNAAAAAAASSASTASDSGTVTAASGSSASSVAATSAADPSAAAAATAPPSPSLALIRFRPRAPNMVRLQGEGKYVWTLKNFSRLSREERIYSPPFVFGSIGFMLLLFPRGNQQREYASLYVSVADKTRLPPDWRRQVQFSLCVVDQRESLCSVTKSTRGELSNQVLDWGFTELAPLSTLHSSNHGYILDDTLQFTIQFERISESNSGRSSNTAARLSLM